MRRVWRAGARSERRVGGRATAVALAIGAGLLGVGHAAAAPYQGFIELVSGTPSVVDAALRIRGREGRGRIESCPRDISCAVAGAELAFALSAWPAERQEETKRLTGTLALADGTTCTLAGDVWTVRARGQRVRDGGLRAAVRCPGGDGTLELYIREHRQRVSDA
jgi:hypothetical protein